MNDVDILMEWTWLDPLNLIGGIAVLLLFGALFLREKKK